MTDICLSCGQEVENKFPCGFTGCHEIATYEIKIELWHVEYLIHKKLCKDHARLMTNLIQTLMR